MATTAKIILQTATIDGEAKSRTLSNVNPDYVVDQTSETTLAKMQLIDTGMRQLNALTTNSYRDCVYSLNISVNEYIFDHE